jgi:asparagine N-glycosylation enzyme membrane subunit Stt3
MKTSHSNVRLIFSGDTVLLVFGALLFLASLANATQRPMLRHFRFCGIVTTLFSLTFLMLSSLELFKHQRRKRTILAATLFLAATVICLSGTRIVFEQGN